MADLKNLAHQNVCAIVTPPGRGAIAVVVVSGDSAYSTVAALFQSASGAVLSKADQKNDRRSQQIFYGIWSTTGEDVVIIPRPALATPTLEIHCHGGQFAPAAILDSLKSAGHREVKRGESGVKSDAQMWRFKIREALSRSMTERTAKILLRQLSLDQQLQFLDSLANKSQKKSIADLETILSWKNFARHLVQPWSVVFCGQPNVGKSSLMNRIAGFERAIVHETAGTTRDVVTHITAVDGWPVEIKDTAGLRDSTNQIEREGIRLAREKIRDADLVVVVHDVGKQESEKLEFDSGDWLPADAVQVFNKCDLITPEQRDEIKARSESNPLHKSPLCKLPIFTSATTGEGLDQLILAIASRLVPEIPATNQVLAITSWQVEAIEKRLRALEKL